MAPTKTVKLNTGAEIPTIGLGASHSDSYLEHNRLI